MVRNRRQFCNFLPGLVFAVALGPAVPAVAGSYSPPDTKPGDKGWSDYVDPPMLDSGSARGLEPRPETPEAAVVLFLASRIRGDGAWKKAMTADPGRRAKRALAKWQDWKLRKAQLRARKLRGENRGYVRVWFELSISGKTETGTDDFTVVKEAGVWRIKEPPS